MTRRSKIVIKLQAAQRYMIWHYLQPIFSNIRVAEFPKSGGTWLCQMLGEMFCLDFPRHTKLPWKSTVQHSHYSGPTKYKTIVLIRDGRDVMTSAYFHFLNYSNQKPSFLVDYWRSLVPSADYNNVENTMPTFLRKFSTEFRIAGKRMRWSDHVMSYSINNANVYFIKYEDLLQNTERELRKIANWYDLRRTVSYDRIIEKYSFQNQSNRKPGEEDGSHFLRKGVVGDWKNYFNTEAIEVFNGFNREALDFYGYV